MTRLHQLSTERDSLLRRITAKRPGVVALRARLVIVTHELMREEMTWNIS